MSIKNPIAAASATLSSSLRDYTQVLFAAQFKKPFITSHHHDEMFKALQEVVDGNCNKLIINIAPRYSKTEIVVKSFISWCFAINPASKFIHLSYSDMLVTDNSRAIQEIMQEPIYTGLFPGSGLPNKRTSGTKWNTTAGGGLYAVSTQGQVTGFGAGEVDPFDSDELDKFTAKRSPKEKVFAGAIVIDDPIKPEDALSDTVRERVNQRFENTIRNRVNSRHTPIIIIMQRLHEHDLCGYLQEIEPGEWKVLSMPCIQVDDQGKEQPLWPHKHTLEELYKIKNANSYVFETQYQQDPKPIEGLMYSNGFKEYEKIPVGKRHERKNYTDTADTGSDYLCSICYEETEIGCYVTEVLYTKKPMEYTEPATAEMLTRNNTQTAVIESNNGGRGFARAVEKQLRIAGNKATTIKTFTQTENKAVRIFSKSAEVQNMIHFPVGWQRRWPEYSRDLTGYRKEGNNKHDDAPDATTGIVEKYGSKTTVANNPRLQEAIY
ncbi:MAG: phage terminase large subunit [Bacteroidia bacterium]|nr:phage terminase large subunit [Bacteroidia bacterium]